MKKVLSIIIFIYIFFIFPTQLSATYLEEKLLILLVSDLSIKDHIFQPKGIYSLLHMNPKKDYKDFLSDLQKANIHFSSMTKNQYLSRGYQFDDPIIIVNDIIKSELHQFLSAKPNNRTFILTSFSNRINPFYTESNKTGIFYSNATKREGFIKYSDLFHIINAKDSSSRDFILFRSKEDPIRFLQNLYNKSTSLLYGRYILISYIFIIFICFLQSRKRRIFYGYLLFLCPLLSTFSGFSPFIYLNGVIKSILIITLSFIIGYLFYMSPLAPRKVFTILWTSTFLVLLYFTFSRIYLYQSPIGFNNIFRGTRFYGWNNDLIGIFLGSLLGNFYIWSNIKKKFFLIPITFFLAICILCFSPLYGANVGGMFSCLCSIIVCIVIFQDSIIKKSIYIPIILLGFILIQNYFIQWDLEQASSTHWGIWIQSVQNKEFSYPLEIIYIKIKKIIYFLLIPPLNIILFFQWTIMLKIKNLDYYTEKWKNIFLIISFSITILNDSGVLSAIIMLFYFLIPIYTFHFSIYKR